MDPLSQIGVGGVFAVFILREVFNLLEKRKNGNTVPVSKAPIDDAFKKTVYDMAKQVDDLWEWHKVTDEDGVKVWYVRASLERAIQEQSAALRELREAVSKQTQALERMNR